MSYILEALKKAQAERQIGSAPTIHAPTLTSAPAGQGSELAMEPEIDRPMPGERGRAVDRQMRIGMMT